MSHRAFPTTAGSRLKQPGAAKNCREPQGAPNLCPQGRLTRREKCLFHGGKKLAWMPPGRLVDSREFPAVAPGALEQARVFHVGAPGASVGGPRVIPGRVPQTILTKKAIKKQKSGWVVRGAAPSVFRGGWSLFIKFVL